MMAEILDNRKRKNQSLLHQQLTDKTEAWLNKLVTLRGLVWRDEHQLHTGLKPDATAFCSLQLRHYCEYLNVEPVYSTEVHKRMNLKRGDIYTKELYIKTSNELCAERYYADNEFMIIFESKVSMSDFNNTFKNGNHSKNNVYANFHFLVIPKGFSDKNKLEKLPSYWGILEQSGVGLRLKKLPKYTKIDRTYFLEAAYTMLFKK